VHERGELTHLVRGFLARQAPIVARALAEKYAAPSKAIRSRDTLLQKLDLDNFDLSDWAELVPDVQSILVRTNTDGAGAGLQQLDVTGGITQQAHEEAAEWAKDRSAELVGMKYDDAGKLVENPDAEWAITDSTRDMLRSDVTRAIDMGLSTDDFADELEGSYAFSTGRAEAIARTEIASADIQGTLIGYRDSGEVSGKELILSSEHGDTPDDCDDAADMGIVPLDDSFGGLGDPPFHPNCACDVLPVLATDEDDDG
jgi:hypothetical protein